MTVYRTEGTVLSSIADAIRAKTSQTAKMQYPTEFISAINGISVSTIDQNLILQRQALFIGKTLSDISKFSSFTEIQKGWFTAMSITEASFPECSYVDERAFERCKNLISVSFPVCTSIGSYAFAECSQLTTTYFPECTEISEYAFASCSRLSNVTFSNCVTIGSSAFMQCSTLSIVHFPKCKTIGICAFLSCSSMKEMYFPECMSIYDCAFIKCFSLTSIYFMGSSVAQLMTTGYLFDYHMPDDGDWWDNHEYAYVPPNLTIYVPASLEASYKSTGTPWSLYSSVIVGI